MAEIDLGFNLQNGSCQQGPAEVYASFYVRRPGASPVRSRPVFLTASSLPQHLMLEVALREFQNEARRASIGAVSLLKTCHRKEHKFRPRLERVAALILADRTSPRTATHPTEPVYRQPVNGIGAVRPDLPSLSVAENVVFFPVTAEEAAENPVTEIMQLDFHKPPMYVALRGLEQVVDLRH